MQHAALGLIKYVDLKIQRARNAFNLAWWAAKIFSSKIVGLQASYVENYCYRELI